MDTHQLRLRASGPPGFRGGGCWPPGPPRSSLWPYVVALAETVVLKGAIAEREAKAGRRAVRKRAVDDLADMMLNLVFDLEIELLDVRIGSWKLVNELCVSEGGPIYCQVPGSPMTSTRGGGMMWA